MLYRVHLTISGILLSMQYVDEVKYLY
jgi:hypothetical protein